MAYANWISPSKTSGSGNDTVSISAASSNTGRSARTTTLTFSAANCENITRTVIQAGKPEFVSCESVVAVEKTGGTVTITGKSNSSLLGFRLGTGDLPVTLPSTYTAAGVTTNLEALITGDPGDSAEFDWSISFDIEENTTLYERIRQIIIVDAAGNSKMCNIAQTAGDPYLTVAPESVNLPYDASTSASFTVTSNTSWSIS